MVYSNSDGSDCKYADIAVVSDRYDCKYADIAVVENACDPGKWLLKARCKSCPDDNGCSVADIVDDWFCSVTTLSSRVRCALSPASSEFANHPTPLKVEVKVSVPPPSEIENDVASVVASQ